MVIQFCYATDAELSVEQDLAKLPGLKYEDAKISILRDISGVIKPSRKVLEMCQLNVWNDMFNFLSVFFLFEKLSMVLSEMISNEKWQFAIPLFSLKKITWNWNHTSLLIKALW